MSAEGAVNALDRSPNLRDVPGNDPVETGATPRRDIEAFLATHRAGKKEV